MLISLLIVDLRFVWRVLSFCHQPLALCLQTSTPITRLNTLSTTEMERRHTRELETHLRRAQVCFLKSFFFSTKWLLTCREETMSTLSGHLYTTHRSLLLICSQESQRQRRAPSHFKWGRVLPSQKKYTTYIFAHRNTDTTTLGTSNSLHITTRARRWTVRRKKVCLSNHCHHHVEVIIRIHRCHHMSYHHHIALRWDADSRRVCFSSIWYILLFCSLFTLLMTLLGIDYVYKWLKTC